MPKKNTPGCDCCDCGCVECSGVIPQELNLAIPELGAAACCGDQESLYLCLKCTGPCTWTLTVPDECNPGNLTITFTIA